MSAYSENKRRKPQQAQGFHTLQSIMPAGSTPSDRLHIYAERADGTTIREFDSWQSARNFITRYCPTGYVVSRWFSHAESAWLNHEAWYSPLYRGPRLKLRSRLDRYTEKPPRPRPKPITSHVTASVANGLDLSAYDR